MGLISHAIYRSIEVLVFIAAAAIFIPAISTNARFIDENVFSCAFSESGDVAACIWCCIVKFVAEALQAIIDFLGTFASVFGGGSISNPLTDSGGSPSQCLKRQGSTSNLTTFYALFWTVAVMLFVIICMSILSRIGKAIKIITYPITLPIKFASHYLFEPAPELD